ncbi:hypothetical protein GGR50DRAFT_165589 [Xylaria sp. CBS 124048]|nr:hypothetical protein GGR50DRAFT_165589 [Xylaria sp. CBS 124048]
MSTRAAAGPEPEPQWPPRSPAEALLSTPGGRQRYLQLAEQRSPSASPSKRAPRPISVLSQSRSIGAMGHDDDGLDLDLDVDNDDDDDDEETLQLQLAAIQAKLKLKKVQAAKAKKAQESNPHIIPLESRRALDAAISSRAQLQPDDVKSSLPARPQSQGNIQVPASPVRRAQSSLETTSPSRVRLGIDKGLKAKDVSLKRAPNLKKTLDAEKGPHGGYLRRSNTPVPGLTTQDRPKSFSERLAAARTDEQARRQRHEKVQQLRAKAFHLGRDEMEELKKNATEVPDLPTKEEEFSREDVMAGKSLKRERAMPGSPKQAQGRNELTTEPEAIESETRKPKVAPSDVPEDEAVAFEPYSSIHLKKRIIPHSILSRNLANMKTFGIQDLLRQVVAPAFELPDVEQDIVVFGILASKSEPRTHKDGGNKIKEKEAADPTRTKYMVLTLVDLKWELELYLFGSGFERYWKLTPGTLLAILNPNIMPPAPNKKDTGRFSLVINSGIDTILEVGLARDLGFCKSVKKDGALCSSWVNSKRTEFCEFHMNLALSKKRLARQDVNAFDTGLGPTKQQNSRRLHNWDNNGNEYGKKRRGNFDRESQSAFFVRKATTATMMDNEVLGGEFGSAASTIERKEALRRRLATEEKERDLMKKLGEFGKGAGKEYMSTGRPTKTRGANQSGTGSGSGSGLGSGSGTMDDPRPNRDAKSLGLISDGNSKKMHLSPVKRKRGESLVSARSECVLGSSAGGAGASAPKLALGWGGGLKDKLSRMKEGEKLNGARARHDEENPNHHTTTHNNRNNNDNNNNDDRSRSPARKKTRFVTAKGIREAGRESLGDELATTGRRTIPPLPPRKDRGMMYLDDDDDDDDELIILR